MILVVSADAGNVNYLSFCVVQASLRNENLLFDHTRAVFSMLCALGMSLHPNSPKQSILVEPTPQVSTPHNLHGSFAGIRARLGLRPRSQTQSKSSASAFPSHSSSSPTATASDSASDAAADGEELTLRLHRDAFVRFGPLFPALCDAVVAHAVFDCLLEQEEAADDEQVCRVYSCVRVFLCVCVCVCLTHVLSCQADASAPTSESKDKESKDRGAAQSQCGTA